MTGSVREIGETARIMGMRPSQVLDCVLRALEDEAGTNAEGLADFHEGRRRDVSLAVEVVENSAL